MRPPPERAILWLIAVATALRLLLAAIVDLGLDEAYAMAVSRDVQLSWYDHPPLAFWIVGTVQAMFGLHAPELVLRLPFIGLSAATTWLLYRLAERHFGAPAGLWAALLFTAAPFFFFSAGSWLVPDGPLVFFLTLTALALSPIVLDERRSNHWRHWLIAGSALGLALLSKYHAGLFAVGAALFFIGSPGLRVWLLRPQPYVAALIAVLIFSPAIIWNAYNDWASFAFQLGRGTGSAGAAGGLGVLRLFAFEALYLLPTTALILLIAIFWGMGAKQSERRSAWFFLALGLPAILVPDLARFWSAESFPHWSMPGWLFLMPVAGALLAAIGRSWPVVTTSVAAMSLVLFGAAVGGVILFVSDWRAEGVFGVDMAAFRVEAGSWTGVAEGIREADVLRDDMILAAGSWRDASRVVEALRSPLPILALEADPHGFAWLDQDALIGRDALLVTRSWETAALLPHYAPYFQTFEPVGSYPIEAGNRHVMDVMLARNFRSPYPRPYGGR